jgi:hypothetical protein
MHELEEQGRPLLYDDAFFLQTHFIDGHESMTHGDECQPWRRRYEVFGVLLPSLFGL